MEFTFNVNNLFEDEITVVDSRLLPYRNSQNVRNQHQAQMQEAIDKMGMASYKAQGLHGPITSASKLSYSNHHLYVMKDAEANEGNGALVGILKVGHKKLFVYDQHGGHHEMEPLCVLDFYVHESRQRHGCGKKLFQAMLQKEEIKAAHLAVDRPSHKFTSFLQKHYNLKHTIPQVNNFVIFDGFFKDRPDKEKRGGSGKPPVHPYRNPNVDRFAAGLQSRPASGHMSALSLDPSRPLREVRSASDMDRLRRQASGGNLLAWDEPRDAFNNIKPVSNARGGGSTDLGLTPGGLVAQQNMYSRHSPASEPSNRGNNIQLDIPSSTSHDSQTNRDGAPLRSRNGPSEDYVKFTSTFTNPSSYMDTRGRLRVESAATSSPTHTRGENKPAENTASLLKKETVSSQPSTQTPPSMYSRKYNHTRLW